ncbi:16S rRNA (uracil(1498)-N(3))-methyltransferase [Marinobacterium sedimentorum]|uniref:16S rRNA (uracil(1498)-N(3))-methyltransferase n=1 Tax=Marinobacterium sedimentorum TaxID=2927804 RepID=UPI0020C68A62|nr:16S rRNA (uracil(1498)-N(3))-methyltransferase [Marinobacterium sedimentorum]MCP8689554.1 16S rRNA (uracil(1498)-N(3))-methyltransferase [Marinobacterium sedimentorum]
MNLILLFDDDFIAPARVRLSDRRYAHIRAVQQPEAGETLKVGLLNGAIGRARVLSVDDQSIELETCLEETPPTALPLTLIMALPRPKMLKRTLQTIATMGVKRLCLINSYRVDKSYWSSPLLGDDTIREQLLLGLEQAGDTQLPDVSLHKRFKPFVEDELPAIAADTRALVAHPYEASECPPAEQTPTTLAIGPEGGFIRYEVEKLQQAGLAPIHVGQRILRVETAVPVLLARLFPPL